MPTGTTINAQCYCETVKKLHTEFQKGYIDQVCLRRDNVRPHVSYVTTELFNQFGLDILTHTPYSLDLAPSNYYLFSHMKKHIGGKRFYDDYEVKEEINNWLK